MAKRATKYVGVLTSGGDSPGLNAALRAIGKAATGRYEMQVIGFRDGFRGLMENRTVWLDDRTLSGILTHGGTILGTSRDKPNAMPVAGKVLDMTDLIVEIGRHAQLEAAGGVYSRLCALQFGRPEDAAVAASGEGP